MGLKTLKDFPSQYFKACQFYIVDQGSLDRENAIKDEELSKICKKYFVLGYEHLLNDLRQEAINWIKWFDLHSNPDEVYKQETRSSEEAYFYAKIDLESINRKDAIEIIRSRIAIRDWIKYFFNITEEELKP